MAKYLDLEVSLIGVEPRIWRRFLLARRATFLDLHHAIQDACGWEDYHLWEFQDERGQEKIAVCDHSEYDDGRMTPLAGDVLLVAWFARKAERCVYVYDFGDYWEHLVELKGVVELPEKFVRRLTGGERAFPPEDCGSLPGYEACCEAFGISDEQLRKVKREDPAWWEDLQNRKEWLGDWDPERLDLKALKAAFDR